MLGFLALLIALQATTGGIAVGLVAIVLAHRRPANRSSLVRRAETARTGCRIVMLAAPLATLTATAQWLLGYGLPAPPGGWPAALCLGGIAVYGSAAILAAGRAEARGRRRRAARRVDPAGRLMFLGAGTYAVVVFGRTVLATSATREAALPGAWSPALLALGAIGVGLAGFLGLLAGLSRKPRPTGGFAALSYVAGQAVLLAAPAWGVGG